MRRLAIVLILTGLTAPLSMAQNVKLSGLVYMDYEYLLSAPDEEDEGENAFGYRRLYLTGDYGISEDFSARARLEANDGSTTAEGRPAPFVKDLYLKWKNAIADGHDIQIGITSPPSFTVAEKSWGYRSLEKTVMDRNKIVSSRDFGVIFKGRVTSEGTVKYGLMLANNSGVSAESDKNKRVYGQIEFYPSESIAATVGGDFTTHEDGRDNTVNGNAFVGYSGSGIVAGAEGVYGSTSFGSTDETADIAAISLFARGELNDKVELVGRYDRVRNEFGSSVTTEHFVIGGVALRPHANVRFIPNILYVKDSDTADGMVTGRVTLHADF